MYDSNPTLLTLAGIGRWRDTPAVVLELILYVPPLIAIEPPDFWRRALTLSGALYSR